MDTKVIGPTMWNVLDDMCSTVLYVAKMQQIYNESSDIRVCKCRSKSQRALFCYAHIFDSVQVVNEARKRNGSPLLKVSKDGTSVEEFKLVKCVSETACSDPVEAKRRINERPLCAPTHHCLSCFGNVGIIPQSVVSYNHNTWHAQTLEDYLTQMFHSLSSVFPCIFCRSHFGLLFSNLWMQPPPPPDKVIQQEMQATSSSASVSVKNYSLDVQEGKVHNYYILAEHLKRVTRLVKAPEFIDYDMAVKNAASARMGIKNGVQYLWLVRNAVNASRGSPIHRELWYLDYSKHFHTTKGSPEHLWKLVIVTSLARYTNYDKVMPEYVSYMEERNMKQVSSMYSSWSVHAEKTRSSGYMHKLRLGLTQKEQSEWENGVNNGDVKFDGDKRYIRDTLFTLCAERALLDEQLTRENDGEEASTAVASASTSSIGAIPIQRISEAACHESAHACRTSLPHLLETFAVIGYHSPTYASVSPYIWPIPFIDISGSMPTTEEERDALAGSEDEITNELVRREWEWYAKYRTTDILVNRILNDQACVISKDEDDRPPPSVAMKMYEEYHATVKTSKWRGKYGMPEKWMSLYVEATVRHYKALLL